MPVSDRIWECVAGKEVTSEYGVEQGYEVYKK